MSIYIEQEERIEKIDKVYNALSFIRKITNKDIKTYNIATSFHNKIVDLEWQFKNSDKTPKGSLLFMTLNDYLMDEFMKGMKALKDLCYIDEEDEYTNLGKIYFKRKRINNIINEYTEHERKIRYFDIKEDIIKVFEERYNYETIPDNVIDNYNKELKELNINVEIPKQRKYQKTKHIR